LPYLRLERRRRWELLPDALGAGTGWAPDAFTAAGTTGAATGVSARRDRPDRRSDHRSQSTSSAPALKIEEYALIATPAVNPKARSRTVTPP
jgi:hypothetical protein